MAILSMLTSFMPVVAGHVNVASASSPGDLDVTFGGGDGVVTTPIGPGFDFAYGAAIQTDGKIVVTGYSSNGTNDDFAVARYNTDGALDTTFSGDGLVTTSIGAVDDIAYGVAIQTDGKIVAAGTGGNSDFAIVRYNPDGTLDLSFGGGDGIVTTPAVGIAYEVAIQPDAKIVAGSGFVIARYLSDGTLDPSFGGGDGITSITFGISADAFALALQPNGKIIGAGYASDGVNRDFALARFNSDGSPDLSFSGDGKLTTDLGCTCDAVQSVAVQTDGKIVAAGSNADFALARYNPNGSLDTSFSGDGLFSVGVGSIGFDGANDVAVQLDGKIDAGGVAPGNLGNDFALIRLNSDGSLDTSFSSDGIVTTDIAGGHDTANALALQDDGKIVLAGQTLVNSQYDFGVTRYVVTSAIGSFVKADFNGDGYGDLAVGVPGEDVGAAVDTGAVNVLYGSATGLGATGNQFWDETATGSAFDSSGDLFGWAIATGDFNGDGFADLAIGVPASEVGSVVDAGFVSVLYGSSIGLAPLSSQAWTQDSTDVADQAETGDLAGYSVASGDLNGDGFDDLVTGVPAEDVGSIVDAGAVNVIYGSAGGLTATGNQFWNQDSTNINDKAETGDVFGLSVAIGDFDGNGFGDLASGIPGENIGTVAADGGAVSVIYGTAAGLDATGDEYWNQNSTDINDSSEQGDQFGFSVAAGDIDGDGFGDLVAGVPFENVGSVADAGAVNIIYGTVDGLSATGDQYRNQNSSSIIDTAEKNDQFGFAVAIGDFDGDGFGDLAAGVPSEDLTPTDVGAVNVLYGASTGITSTGNQLWDQNSTNINDTAEKGDQFGYSLATGDFGNGTQADLVTGVTFEDVGSVTDAGAVSVIYGTTTGLSATGDQYWNQNSADVLDAAEAGDEFGFGSSSGPGGRPRLPG